MVKRALPLISPAYDTGATEADVREQWDAFYGGLRGRNDPRDPLYAGAGVAGGLDTYFHSHNCFPLMSAVFERNRS